MRTYKTIKTETEEQVTDKLSCDECQKEIEHEGACGEGAEYNLSDAWCNQCGGKSYEFCSLKCLKGFVNKLTGNTKNE